jgi:membrane-bound serine protease (ClpP class)
MPPLPHSSGAENAVRDGASLSESAALQAGVIDLVAGDQQELLEKIDGRTVDVASIGRVKILTKDLQRVAADVPAARLFD